MDGSRTSWPRRPSLQAVLDDLAAVARELESGCRIPGRAGSASGSAVSLRWNREDLSRLPERRAWRRRSSGAGVDQALSYERLLAAATVALRIPGHKGSGRATGFFIAPRIVATCAHVIEGDPDGREIEAEAGRRQFTLRATTKECFRSDEGLDVALLQLAEESEPGPGYVLVADGLAAGDRLWTFGFPEGRYQGGKPAGFVCEGFSGLRQGAELLLARVSGIPVGPGYSGSPVLNRRTGAVCGMLCTSDLRGSAHLLRIADILELNADVEECARGARAAPAELARRAGRCSGAGRWLAVSRPSPSGLSDHGAAGGRTAPVSRCRSRNRSADAV